MRMVFVIGWLVMSLASAVHADDAWTPLFNDKDLTGWRANRRPESFAVENGVLKVHAADESSHLFYVGDLKNGTVPFKNFELQATVRSEPGSNSGIYFHTDINSARGGQHHLSKGYEVQLNSSAKEKRKTGSLYAVLDLDKSPVDETKWFTIRIRVQDKRISVWLDGRQVVDYTEPDDVQRPSARAGRVLDPNGGAIAIQAHDPKSVFYFKDIRVRRLP